jgi:hypothetical protein
MFIDLSLKQKNITFRLDFHRTGQLQFLHQTLHCRNIFRNTRLHQDCILFSPALVLECRYTHPSIPSPLFLYQVGTPEVT